MTALTAPAMARFVLLLVPALAMLAPGAASAPRGGIAVTFFLTHDCPVSNQYAPEMRRICEEYADRGVSCSLVYVDPSLTDAGAIAHARAYGLERYPLVVDRDHRLVRDAGVEIAPEATIVAADERLRYRGRIDDRFVTWGESRRHVRTHDVREALDALLAGKPVARTETPAVGCIIGDLLAAPRYNR
jgi:hypothetical protein